MILYPLICFLYHIASDMFNAGQTLGRVVAVSRISGPNGTEPSMMDFVVRAIVKNMPILIITLFPNIMMLTVSIAVIYGFVPFFHKENRAIHDLAGNTYVVDDSRLGRDTTVVSDDELYLGVE